MRDTRATLTPARRRGYLAGIITRRFWIVGLKPPYHTHHPGGD
ncbi:MAG: hypothetical protein WB523_20775 [Candidatus Sulfotelmatobacter sp.]